MNLMSDAMIDEIAKVTAEIKALREEFTQYKQMAE